MKIAIVNKWDISGGAARAAHRLYDGLKKNAHSVDFLVNKAQSKDLNVHQLELIDEDRMYLNNIIQDSYIDSKRTNLSNTFFSCTYAGVDISENIIFKQADIINLHWVEQFLSLGSLQQIIALNKPIVWTLHDERAFTGGCHYASGCNQFIDNKCNDCIQLIDDPLHFPHSILKAKLKILNDANLTIVSPSQWLAIEAKKSELFSKRRIEVIPNSIETDIFFPVAKKNAKANFGISEDVITMMFGAQNNKEKRKGFSKLMAALDLCLTNKKFLQACNDGKIIILLVGEQGGDIKELPIKSINNGFVNNDKKLSEIYNATDCYILPSLEDNLPNTMLEAMACGTPVIGFNTGGIPDLVKNNENGIVVPKGDCVALSDAIIRMVFDNDMRAIYSKNSAELIKQQFTQEIQSKNYIDLFDELTNEKFSYKKNNPYNIDEIYLPFVAYSVRQELNSHKELNFNIAYALDEFCKTSFVKNPIKKYRAYLKLNKEYFN